MVLGISHFKKPPVFYLMFFGYKPNFGALLNQSIYTYIYI